MAIKDFLKPGFLLINIGLYMVSAILAGIVIGYFLDKWLKTSPLFFLIFLILALLKGLETLLQLHKNIRRMMMLKKINKIILINILIFSLLLFYSQNHHLF